MYRSNFKKLATPSTRLLFIFYFLFPLVAHPTEIIRLSVSSNGDQSEGGDSTRPSISGDGRYIAFESSSSSLVSGDTNENSDIFVFDRVARSITRVSVDSDGNQSTPNKFGGSRDPKISADGKLVFFHSKANNLVNDSQGHVPDLFIHDRITGITDRLDAAKLSINLGIYNYDISADGNTVAIQITTGSDQPFQFNIAILDRSTGLVTLVNRSSNSQSTAGNATQPSVSNDGRFVAFAADDPKLVVEDTNGLQDIFVRDRVTGNTNRVNVSSTGEQSIDGNSSHPKISANGRFVVFESDATNLVVGDANGKRDVFVHDRSTRETKRISLSRSGEESDADSYRPTISSNGSLVTFTSKSSNLVIPMLSGAESHLYVRNLDLNTTELADVSLDHMPSVGGTNRISSISHDGRYIAFSSTADNLVLEDTNSNSDVFLIDRGSDCDSHNPDNQFRLKNNRWEMLSLPCMPPYGTTIEELFGDDIAGEFGDSWIVYTYSTPRYVNPGKTGMLLPGQGIWIKQISGNDVTLDFPDGSRGVPSNFNSNACIKLAIQGCFEIFLNNQLSAFPTWNLIGNPLNNSIGIEFDDLRISTTAGDCLGVANGCNLNEANADQIVSNVFYRYDADFSPVFYKSVTSGDFLNPWLGYWVGQYAGSGELAPVLYIPESN